KDLKLIFEIRHAIVHDAFMRGGPIEWALRKDKLNDVITSCTAFLLLLDRSFTHAFLTGPIRPEVHHEKSEKRHKEVAKLSQRNFDRLKKRYPKSKKSVSELEDYLLEMVHVISDVVDNVTETDEESTTWPPYLVDAYFEFVNRISRYLLIIG